MPFSGFVVTMSHGSESEEGSPAGSVVAGGVASLLGAVRDRFEVPALLVVVATMLWIRLRSYSRFVRDGEVYFSGNDAWYHLRSTQYVVEHWPFTMPFDPWTNFPQGTNVGQFGTLYDQIVATVALILGLGDPSAELVAKVLLVSPAVAGALTAIPTYLIGKRLAGRVAGLFGAVVLLLVPGTFLRRTLVGFADHNGVEPLFQAFAVVGIVVALSVAQEDRPIWELVTAGDWDSLRRSAVWSAIAGVAMGLYLWTWPPGILLLGIFAVYLVLQVLSDYGRRSPDHVAFVAVVSMAVTAFVTLLKFDGPSFTPTKLGLLHPAFALLIAVSAVGLAGLARYFETTTFDNDWVDDNGFRTVVVGASVVALGLVAFVDAGPFGLLRQNLLRFVGFSANAATRTIGEAQPWLASQSAQRVGESYAVLSQYGFAFLTAVIGAVAAIALPLYRRNDDGDRQFLGVAAVVVAFVFAGNVTGVPDIFGGLVGLFGLQSQVAGVFVITAIVFAAAARIRYDAEVLFLFVWAAFLTMAAFTQVRFNYYLAVAVAAFNAYFLRVALGLVDIDIDSGVEAPDVETYQLLTAVLVIMVVLVPVLTVPLTLGPQNARTPNAVQSSQTGPKTGSLVWEESLNWLSDNTPAEGTFGGDGEEMALYGQYERPEDDDFDYSDGAYGVQSWWDYGHWITTRSERIPNANPFQEGAAGAANFLLAPNESAAESALLERGEEADQTRYVMVDYKMSSITRAGRNAKFGAPLKFYDRGNLSRDDILYRQTNESGLTQTFPVYVSSEQSQGARRGFFEKKQRYYESQVTRLYAYHGSRAEPIIRTPFGDRVLVMDYETVQSTGFDIKLLQNTENSSAIRTFPNVTAAERFVERDGSAQIGGFGAYPREPVPALEHYRLVDTSETTAFSSRSYQTGAVREARALGLSPSRLFKTTPSWVKTFERVPGATVSGSGAAPNETLTASVQMRIPEASRGNATTFVYRQQATADADGEFSFTLPYSTTGYEEFGPDNGYTNVTVRAAGPYRIAGDARTNESAYLLRNQALLNVSEADVNGVDDGEVSVTLSETVLRQPEGARNETSGNETATNETTANESVDTGVTVDETGPRVGPTAAGAAPTTVGAVGAVAPETAVAVREQIAVTP